MTVSAEVAGRVAEIRVDFGQSVQQGDIIAELDKREFALRLERSRAALAQALARIGLEPSQEEAAPEESPGTRLAKAQMEDARFKYENAARLVSPGQYLRDNAPIFWRAPPPRWWCPRRPCTKWPVSIRCS